MILGLMVLVLASNAFACPRVQYEFMLKKPFDCVDSCWFFEWVGCPGVIDLPITYKRGNQTNFIGARAYWSGNKFAPLGCGLRAKDFPSGYRNPNDGEFIGSLYVHAGCTFYGFPEHNYIGENVTHLEGPLFLPCVGPENRCTKEFESIIIECKQKMPSCQPTDEWSTAGFFDNSRSSLTSTYEFSYTIGTTWSEEMSKGMSLSATIEASISAGFFDLFETSLGVSVTTGYDWSRTSSDVRSRETTHSVTTAVPGGSTITIQQARGRCGDSVVETEMFRSLVIGSNGRRSVKMLSFETHDP